ncbi:MAG: type I glutamate--ammonia ligase [Deltaproteobacteria bacterium]|nr:MAG: type I glutamate--ammonia ligase [Deltaproteobacteria bacterium]
MKDDRISFLRLQFTDIMGINKNVEVPPAEFEKAVDGKIMFDGSSVEGFARIEESDMLLKPDLSTYCVLPWEEPTGKVARLICDIFNPDGTPFEGCPRLTLKRMCDQARSMGFVMQVGPEPEFFLFMRGENGEPTTNSHDSGGYFDMAPVDRGEDARRAIVEALNKMGFDVEAAHHEVAPAQHEIDFRHKPALECADAIATFRFVVRKVAGDFGLHATFMPKPIFGINGSGMHVHQSLFRGNKNAFYDPKAEYQLSKVALGYIAGLLKRAKEFCAVTNPLVNSFKRLVPGYEAPTHITWSERNRSPLARVPARRGAGTRVELRMPDPACNPYLALTVMLAAGLEGIENGWEPGPPVNRNIFTMSSRQRKRLKIDSLPDNLGQAIGYMNKSKFVRWALGDHIYKHFLDAKKKEWLDYIARVHEWEIDRYLGSY